MRGRWPSKQLVQETRQPRPSRPGAAMAYDYEYQRNGVSNLFMLFAPLEGWRRVEVTDRRTKADWARVVKKLVDEDYVDKERIVLVMDNLNTHHPASLYQAFEPAEARRIAQRLEIHYTPPGANRKALPSQEFRANAVSSRIPEATWLLPGMEACQTGYLA